MELFRVKCLSTVEFGKLTMGTGRHFFFSKIKLRVHTYIFHCVDMTFWLISIWKSTSPDATSKWWGDQLCRSGFACEVPQWCWVRVLLFFFHACQKTNQETLIWNQCNCCLFYSLRGLNTQRRLIHVWIRKASMYAAEGITLRLADIVSDGEKSCWWREFVS